MFKSLRLKLLFYFFIINFIILFIYGGFIYITAKKAVLNTTDTQLKMISLDVVPEFKDNAYPNAQKFEYKLPEFKDNVYPNAKEFTAQLLDEFLIDPLFLKIIYYNKESKTIEYESISSQEMSHLFEIPLNVMGHINGIYYFNKDIYRVSSMLIFESDNSKVFIQLAIENDIDSPYVRQLSYSLIVATPIILILFLLIANMLINKTLLPVKKVIESVKSISANSLSNRIRTDNIPSEIKELVTTFNHLLNNLEDSFNKITSFTHDASHELKTPLTVIRGEVEVALKHERSVEEYKDILKDILQESISIEEIINQLLFLAKKDTTEMKSNFLELYLDELVTDTALRMKKIAKDKNITIVIKKIIPSTIYANETLLKIAINNIIKNAITYSNNDTVIEISMDETSQEYLLEIKDNGYGINDEDLPFIFDRFYRADKARSRKNAGFGLGLSIVKMILDIHNYKLELKSIKDVGTTITIKIPKNKLLLTRNI
jgi:heavy metal sensor kinase